MNETTYHLNLSTISRRKGQSTVRKAAYNAGDRIRDERRQKTFDYRYKAAGVVAVKVYQPPGVSTELDRAGFWNMVEKQERRWDARVGREFKGAVPHSLSKQGRQNVMDRFCQFVANKLRTTVMGYLHEPGRGDDRNDHFHAQFPTRSYDGVSLGKKHRHLDISKTSRVFVKKCRAIFANIINAELKKEGIAEFVDHRSYQERGISKKPGKHLGPKQWWRKKKLEEEIAASEAEIKRAEAEKLLSEPELTEAIRDLHRTVAALAQSLPPPNCAFSVGADGFLKMTPGFQIRLEKSKQAEAPKKGTPQESATMQEFLMAWTAAAEWIAEQRERKEREDRERRSRERDR